MRRIFVSYRRDDSAGHAGRLADSLRAQGAGEVFLDADTIVLGENFVQRIHREIEQCDLVLVVIGRHWLAPAGTDGRPRIFSARDFVHLEVRAALERNIPVVPVLVDGGRMPEPEELPEVLQELAYRQGTDVEHRSWAADVARLVAQLPPVARAEPVLDLAPAAPATVTEPSSGLPPEGVPGPERRNRHATDVVVVAAGLAYADYLSVGGYVCQHDRVFRTGTARLGFYARKQIHPHVPAVLHRRAEVLFTRDNAARLRQRGEPFDDEVARLIDVSFDASAGLRCSRVEGDRYQVVCLSGPEDPRTLVLDRPVEHLDDKAWTMQHRYLRSEQLEGSPATTAELPDDPEPR